jgi:hypothetical protein
MKKLLFIIVLVVCVSQAYSQIPNTIGAHLSYGTKDLQLGFGARGEFGLSDKFSVSPKFTYHTGKSQSGVSSSGWNLDADAHYYFSTDEIAFYGIAGLTYASATATVDFGFGKTTVTDSKIGINIGAGVNFTAGNLIPFAEVKYNSPFEAILISAGVKFPLGGK